MTAYYNENDPYAAQWLRNLIAAGHIAPGDVDERSIVDVRGDELARYAQAHFFAGIGGWSLALRLAGWPDDRPIWTGSCPCQPFSAAGKGKAADDERHLWPSWFSLIRECRPAIIFGEQVEAAIGWGWLDAVFSDLEAEGYACGATVLPACGVGAPHIRQRVWFVANASELRCNGKCRWKLGESQDASAEGLQRSGEHGQRTQDGRALLVGDADKSGSQGRRIDPREYADQRIARTTSQFGELANYPESRLEGTTRQSVQGNIKGSPSRNTWSDCDWLPCTDGKARPVEPGTFPLAHGIPKRVGRLRAYGNAIVPQLAAEFIAAATGR